MFLFFRTETLLLAYYCLITTKLQFLSERKMNEVHELLQPIKFNSTISLLAIETPPFELPHSLFNSASEHRS